MSRCWHPSSKRTLSTKIDILQMTARDPARFPGQTAANGSVAVCRTPTRFSRPKIRCLTLPISHRIAVAVAGHYHSSDELALMRQGGANARGCRAPRLEPRPQNCVALTRHGQADFRDVIRR